MLVTLNEVLRRRLGHKRFSALYPHFIQQHIVPGAITRSEQLPYARVMAFLRNSLFLERFWREFLAEYLLSSTNQSAKPTDLKMIFLCLLTTFSFISYTSNALIDLVEILFRG